MSIYKKTLGVTVATAAAALFISGAAMTLAPSAAQAAGGVKCMGINACKGHGACKTAENACKGQNVCKGHGFVVIDSAQKCTDAGGKVIK